MRLSPSLLYCSLMIWLTFLVLSGQDAHQQPPAGSPEDTEQCATCDVRQHIKTMRLNAIKSQILSKLRMKEAPNISRDTVKQLLPKAPPLQQLLDQYDVLGDDNRDVVTEEDDEHATTETIMMMATERKCAKVSKALYARARAHGAHKIVLLTHQKIVIERLLAKVNRGLLFEEEIKKKNRTLARRLTSDTIKARLLFSSQPRPSSK